MKISPFIFVLIKNGRLILWDYKLHNQFEITADYLNELVQFENGQVPLNKKILSDLIENNIIINSDSCDYSDQEWGWDDLAKIFHIGTQDIGSEDLSPTEYANKYLNECEESFSEEYIENYSRVGENIRLPTKRSPKMEKAKLIDTLLARRTSRTFDQAEISLEDISALLKITFSSTNRDKERYHSAGLVRIGSRKTSPSGGGLHPSEAYLLAKNVAGLNKGIYHFNSVNCHLTKIQTYDGKVNLGDIFCGQYFANDISAGIFITSVFKKQWWKYKHSRAYRVALLDVGHLSQTLLLCATSLGISTWVSGAFNDTKVSNLLKITSIGERPLLFIGLGYGDGNSIDPETIKILEKIHEYNAR